MRLVATEIERDLLNRQSNAGAARTSDLHFFRHDLKNKRSQHE